MYLFSLSSTLKTVSGSSWTESIKNTTANHTRVNAADALSNFMFWSYIGSDLSGHDHAMLFTKYVCGPFQGVQKRHHLRKYCKFCKFHIEKNHRIGSLYISRGDRLLFMLFIYCKYISQAMLYEFGPESWTLVPPLILTMTIRVVIAIIIT